MIGWGDDMRLRGGGTKLKSLAGRAVGDYRIHVSEPEPTRLGAWRFNLSLMDEAGRRSSPVIRGRYFEGRGKWIRPWLEVEYRPSADFCGAAIELAKGADVELFKALASILLPGSHIMVKYGEQHFDTARALSMNVPPPATPLGYLLWQAGFRWFKDWYFPEGGMEGEQKLQGNKPLDKRHEKKIMKGVVEELKVFIDSEFDWNDELFSKCRGFALQILNTS